MLTRSEADDLLRRLSEYREAWEAYAGDLQADRISTSGARSLVEVRGEELRRFIEQNLS